METAFDPDGPAAEGSGIYGLPHDAAEARVHVLPVPFDATTSYRKGAAQGPLAVFEASKQVDLFDLEFDPPFRAGLHMLEIEGRIHELNAEATELIAGRGHAVPGQMDRALERINAIGAELNEFVHARVDTVLAQGKLPAVLGGDHSVPFGAIEAGAARFPGLGILHVDAHADLRDAYEGYTWSHASILFNVMERVPGISQLVQCGIRDLSSTEHAAILDSARIHTLFDRDWRLAKAAGKPLREIVRAALAPLPEHVWLTFDIDGLDPTLCPNTGTPVPGGFDWHEAMLWLEELAASGRRVVGLDLCEVSAGPDGDPLGEGWDAIVGARLLYRMLGAALSSALPNRA